jgi:hypothetical protein
LSLSFSDCFRCHVSFSPPAPCGCGLSNFSFKSIGLLFCVFAPNTFAASVQEIVLVRRFAFHISSLPSRNLICKLSFFCTENPCSKFHVLVTAFDWSVYPDACNILDPVFSGPLFNLVSPHCYGRGYCFCCV